MKSKKLARVRYLSSIMFLSGALTIAGTLSAKNISKSLVISSKKKVVNIEVKRTQPLRDDYDGTYYGTGFIIDAQQGIIVTNRHVSGRSPAKIKITFENGESAEATIIYTDPFHDFAFLKADLSEVGFKLRAVKIGSAFELSEQDEVFMIGNNAVEEYSVERGIVNNLKKDYSWPHSATFQTTFDSAEGSSGSPVFNETGSVVGIHYAGKETAGFELYSDYIGDALAQVQKDGKAQRGSIGISLKILPIADAEKYFRFPDYAAGKAWNIREGIKHLLQVYSVDSFGPAAGVLLVGDIIVSLNGNAVADDLYKFDKIVNGSTSNSVEVEFYRQGKKQSVLIKVADLDNEKIVRFAEFGGAIIHDIGPSFRFLHNVTGGGVFVSYATPGSPMSTMNKTVMKKLNGHPVNSLEEFLNVAEIIKGEKYINISWGKNSEYILTVTLDHEEFPLKIFSLDTETHKWVEEATKDEQKSEGN